MAGQNIRTYELDPREAVLRPQEEGINALAQAAQHKAQAAYRLTEYGRQTGEAIGGGISALGKPAQTIADQFIAGHAAGDEISKSQNLEGTMRLNMMTEFNQRLKDKTWNGTVESRRVDVRSHG